MRWFPALIDALADNRILMERAMSINQTDAAKSQALDARRQLDEFDRDLDVLEKCETLRSALETTVLALEVLIDSVREDEIQQQAGQVLPVRPVPTGGRRGRP